MCIFLSLFCAPSLEGVMASTSGESNLGSDSHEEGSLSRDKCTLEELGGWPCLLQGTILDMAQFGPKNFRTLSGNSEL